LIAIVAWSDMRTSVIVGSGSAFAIPYATSEGPLAVTTTVLFAVPPTMKPAIITLSPFITSMRVEMLMSRAALAGRENAIIEAATSAPIVRSIRLVVIWRQ